MHLIGVLVLCVVSSTYAGWLTDLTEGRGLQLGGGAAIHLERTGNKNASLIEQHALRLDYMGAGIRIAKALNRGALKLGLYSLGNQFEGRGRKVGEMMLPLVVGFKATGIIALLLTSMSFFVVKALIVAKIALIISAGIILAKALHYHESPHIEIEHHASDQQPVFAEYPSATGYNTPSGSGNYLAYGYAPSAQEGAESIGQYTIVEASNANGSVVAVPQVSKRRDYIRRKAPPHPIITVRKYTIAH